MTNKKNFNLICSPIPNTNETLKNISEQIAYRAQLNPNRWDSTQRWMKFDSVTRWVTAHSERLCTFLQGLPWHLGEWIRQ